MSMQIHLATFGSISSFATKQNKIRLLHFPYLAWRTKNLYSSSFIELYRGLTVTRKKGWRTRKKLLAVIEKSYSLSEATCSQSQAIIDFWSKLPKQTEFEITQAVRQKTALFDKKEKNFKVFGIPESVVEDGNTKI